MLPWKCLSFSTKFLCVKIAAMTKKKGEKSEILQVNDRTRTKRVFFGGAVSNGSFLMFIFFGAFSKKQKTTLFVRINAAMWVVSIQSSILIPTLQFLASHKNGLELASGM